MTVVIGGSSPEITFADSTVQNTAALPLTGGAVSADITVHGLTIGLGGNSVSSNTVVGNGALTYNTTGSSLTCIGAYALQSNTTGVSNAATGYGALNANTTGSYNSGFGAGALQNSTTASNNTAVGYQAGYSNSTNQNCTFVGYQAGYASTGDYNCLIGRTAGQAITSGAKNTVIGSYSGNNGGLDIRTSSNYIVLSDGDGNVRGVFDSNGNFLIGETSTGYQSANGCYYSPANGYWINNHLTGTSSGVRYQGFGYGVAEVGSITQSGTTAVLYNVTSDQRLKENIVDAPDASADIDAIKVRSFDFISDKSPVKYGFIAQELVTVAPDAVHQPENPDDMMGVDYSKLVPMMLKEIQSLRARLKAANIA